MTLSRTRAHICVGTAQAHSDARQRSDRTGSQGYDNLWRGDREIGLLKRVLHVVGHGAGDQQSIGMSRRGHEAQAEAFEIVEGVVEGMNFQLAAIAGTGVHLANRQAAAEPLARRALAIWAKTFGPEHANVAVGLNAVAQLARLFGPQAAQPQVQLLVKASKRLLTG